MKTVKIQTIDGAGQPVVIDGFPAARHAALTRFVNTLDLERHPGNDMEPNTHVVGQLAFLETQALAAEYEPRKYQELLGPCITSEAGEWAETVLYRITDRTGKGKRINPSGNNMPMADVATSQASVSVAGGGIGYSYNTQEVRASARFQTPLPMDRQTAAVEGCLDHLDDVALKGEAESNFQGLFSYSGVDAATRASAAVWDAASADTILSDINVLLGNVYSKSKTIHPPSHLVVPPSRIVLLTKPRSTTSDTMVWDYIQKNNLYTKITGKPLTIVPGTTYLETAGGSSSKRAMAFTPAPTNLKFHLPMTQRFGSPQQQMLTFVVPSEYRYGGLDFKKKYTAEYMDGL
jgi:hypothetical protein